MISETVINYGIVSSTLINKDIRKVNFEPTNFRYFISGKGRQVLLKIRFEFLVKIFAVNVF